MQAKDGMTEIAFDDTFRFAKRCIEEAFSCLQRCRGGSGHILTYKLAEKKGWKSFARSLRLLGERVPVDSPRAPKVLYTDQCCIDRSTAMTELPSLLFTDTGHGYPCNLPEVTMPLVTKTVRDGGSSLEAALSTFSSKLTSVFKLGGEDYILLPADVEYTPATTYRPRGKVGALVFANGEEAIVVQPPLFPSSPALSEQFRPLQKLLSEPLRDGMRVALVGVGIGSDATLLNQDVGILAQTLDLRSILVDHWNLLQGEFGERARKAGVNPKFGQHKTAGTLLQILKIFCCETLPAKGISGVRCSAWSLPIEYSPQQFRYVCVDGEATRRATEGLLSAIEAAKARVSGAHPPAGLQGVGRQAAQSPLRKDQSGQQYSLDLIDTTSSNLVQLPECEADR